MKRVLLTGASGFIGSRIRRLLIQSGYETVLFSRRHVSVDSSLARCFVGDLRDPLACSAATRGMEVVVHAAGVKRRSDLLWPVNVHGTQNLLAAAVENGVARFVHVSSVGVMGVDPLENGLFGEDTVCSPQNDYERSKWQAEKRVRRASEEGLSIAILRPANVFGDRDPERGLLTLARRVQQGRFIYLGGREAKCNYVFVEDVAHASMALLERPRSVRQTFHLADGCTLGQFIDTLADALGVARPSAKVPESVTPFIRFLLRVGREVPRLARSPTFARLVSLNNQASFATDRLAEDLGFRCPVGWRAGVHRMVEWYRSTGDL